MAPKSFSLVPTLDFEVTQQIDPAFVDSALRSADDDYGLPLELEEPDFALDL